MRCELDVRRASRQSLCATRNLSAGQVIGPDDITIKRPGTGIPAARRDAIIGRTLAADCPADHLLRPEHLQDGLP
jgi:sialic acid synthase SpsE